MPAFPNAPPSMPNASHRRGSYRDRESDFFRKRKGRIFMNRRLLVFLWLGLSLGYLLNAAPAQAAPCAAAWNCGTSYAKGAQVSFNGNNYTMGYSRAASCPGFNPSLDNWWINNGPCNGGGGGSTPPPPGPVATPTPPSGGGGGGSFFQAAYWTRGDDPCTRSGPAGSGQPWQSISSCAGCAAWNSSTDYTGGARVSRSCNGGGGTNPTATPTPSGT